MLDIDPDAVAIAFDRRIRGKRTAGRLHSRGVAAAIRILALLHVVLVTTGAMDSSWAMAKSLAMSHSPITNEEALYQPAGPDAPAPDLALYGSADQCALAFGAPRPEADALDLERLYTSVESFSSQRSSRSEV